MFYKRQISAFDACDIVLESVVQLVMYINAFFSFTKKANIKWYSLELYFSMQDAIIFVEKPTLLMFRD